MTLDVLLVSLGTTRGWRVADALFLEQIRTAGASAEAVGVGVGATRRLRRGYPVNDLVEMTAARRTIAAAVRARRPRALVVSTTTAAMLLPSLQQPYAVRLDAPARMNRPGARNAPLHALERRALGRAALVLPWSEAARGELPPNVAPTVVLPPPVEPSSPRAATPADRERLAVAYVPDPKAKGLDVLCAGWAAAGVADARLAVFGIEPERARAFLARVGLPEPPRIEWAGLTEPATFRAALRRAHVYVGTARWEDFGQAPLEALADGALLATVPSGGPFEALAFARSLAPELVAASLAPADLGAAIRAAFAFDADAPPHYRRRAAALLRPFRPEALQETVRTHVLPALLESGA
jgi:glycosyl transferase family 1